MKVLDLQCRHKHIFEGWFASEEDYLQQLDGGLVECPVCGDGSINKRPSAPRLNLVGVRNVTAVNQDVGGTSELEKAWQAVWIAVARRIVATTDDVGERFAEEARKIHYGETKERPIRGQASHAEAEALLDEGVAVMPFLLPEALKKPLQ